jgi:uncharacterized caspase-like protein
MWRRALAVLVCGLLLAVAGGARADGEKRVALVVGNGGYQHLPRLDNPTKDARLMADSLKSAGFELIGGGAQTDLDRAGFERAIRQFGAALGDGAIGLFYYAGHGLQLQGVNYLVPVGANPTSAADADFELIDAQVVLKQMEGAGSRLNIVVLDACRNNPFGGRGLRAAGGGLAQMQAPRGTLISYATQPGNVALDGNDGHSPYTAALAKAIAKPGAPVLEVFNDVGLAVDKKTLGRQQPWVSSSPIEGNFYFKPIAAGTPAPPPASAAVPAVSGLPSDETLFWQTIAQSKNPADFQEYLRQYPDGRFAGLARTRAAAVAVPPPVAPPPSNPTPPSEPPAPPAAHGGSPPSFAELNGMSCAQLELARNEIFARRGRFFQRADLQNYFAKFPWYHPTTWNPELTPAEKANVEVVTRVERQKGCRW